MKNNRQTGTIWESFACDYLTQKGYSVITTNYRCKIGEIDIIATQNNTIIFVEVKYRKTSKYGSSLDAVNYSKQSTIRKVAQFYMMSNGIDFNNNVRFDVIGIDGTEVTHIEDAF